MGPLTWPLRRHLVPFVLLFASSAGGTGWSREMPPPDAVDCGAKCLYVMLNLEGRPTGLDAILGRLPLAGPEGHSLLQLRETAHDLGLNLAGFRRPAPGLAPDRPLIALIRRGGAGHFVVVRPVGHTGRLVQVIDPEAQTDIIDEDQLTRSPEWTGLGLERKRFGRLPWLFGGIASVAAFLGLLARKGGARRVG